VNTARDPDDQARHRQRDIGWVRVVTGRELRRLDADADEPLNQET
jgi:hypothetical protein